MNVNPVTSRLFKPPHPDQFPHEVLNEYLLPTLFEDLGSTFFHPEWNSAQWHWSACHLYDHIKLLERQELSEKNPIFKVVVESLKTYFVFALKGVIKASVTQSFIFKRLEQITQSLLLRTSLNDVLTNKMHNNSIESLLTAVAHHTISFPQKGQPSNKIPLLFIFGTSIDVVIVLLLFLNDKLQGDIDQHLKDMVLIIYSNIFTSDVERVTANEYEHNVMRILGISLHHDNCSNFQKKRETLITFKQEHIGKQRVPLVLTEENELHLVEAALKAGAHCNVRDIHGTTPLMHAGPKVAACLLNSKANVSLTDWQGNTALHHAARKNRTSVVRALLEKKASVFSVNNANKRPLDITLSAKNPEIVWLLIMQGAPIENPAALTITINIEIQQGQEILSSTTTTEVRESTSRGVKKWQSIDLRIKKRSSRQRCCAAISACCSKIFSCKSKKNQVTKLPKKV